MHVYTTEVTSETIPSDNPIHQRLLKAYFLAKDYTRGQLLELGCGEGRGIEILDTICESYTAVDKMKSVVEKLNKDYPKHTFIHSNIPPFKNIESNKYSTVVAFQVIEHIKDDRLFLQEIYRVLEPGGKALITTPNIKKSLTRNPWHIREYEAQELLEIARRIFDKIELKGITGSEKIWKYYEQNKTSVERITRFDIFNLQHRLPAKLLRIPYEILNRINRNKLQNADDRLVAEITLDDYFFDDDPENCLDLFLIASKISKSNS